MANLDVPRLRRALDRLLDVVDDMVPGLNEGDFEKEEMQDKIDFIRREIKHATKT